MDVQEAVKNKLAKGSYWPNIWKLPRERMRLTNMPRVVREIAMAGYQLWMIDLFIYVFASGAYCLNEK